MERFFRNSASAVFAFIFVFAALFSLSSKASAATLSISPSASQHGVGATFSESVLVNSGGVSINAASGVISFPPSTLQVVSISESSSVVNFWAAQPSFDNSGGTINFEGVVLNPGFSGSSGNVITVTFRAKAEGQSTLSFVSGSVLANDGLGTNVLSSMSNAAVSVVAAANQGDVTSAPAVNPLTPPAPKITSLSNPDPNGWAATTTPSFSWPVSSDVTAVRILYDGNPSSLPSILYNPPISSKNLSDIADGIYYLHVQLQNKEGWGGISNYRFQIDTVSPNPFSISFANATSSAPSESVSFLATDALSGIDHYSIQIDSQNPFNVTPGEVGTSYALPAQSSGSHTLIVTAFDRAGNSTISTGTFTVGENQIFALGQLIINYASVAVVAALIIAVLIGLSWRVIRKLSRLKQEVRREVGHAEDILHRSFDLLKEDINDHARLLIKAKTHRALTKEEELFLKKFGGDLKEAESIITKEMRSLDELK